MDKPYRLNAGIVVVNSKGQVLLCALADRDTLNWQFPQGGINKNESPQTAALRELYEETGIISVNLLASIPYTLRYDFPPAIAVHHQYRGQEQYWFLYAFTGDDTEINLKINPNEIEFSNYRWGDIAEAPKTIVEFKKEVYNKVVEYFTPIIKQHFQGIKNGL